MDRRKITKKFVSTTISNDKAQLIFLSGVKPEVSFSFFTCIVPNFYYATAGAYIETGRLTKANVASCS